MQGGVFDAKSSHLVLKLYIGVIRNLRIHIFYYVIWKSGICNLEEWNYVLRFFIFLFF